MLEYNTANAQSECRNDAIIACLDRIFAHLKEAHGICDEIHGSQPSSKAYDGQEPSASRLDIVEDRVGSIGFAITELTPRLRDILSRLGQVK